MMLDVNVLESFVVKDKNMYLIFADRYVGCIQSHTDFTH